MKNFIKKNFNLDKFIKSISVIYLYFCSNIFIILPMALFKLDLNKISLKTTSYLNLYISIVLILIIFLIYHKDLIKEFKSYINNFWDNFDTGLKHWLLGLLIMFVSNLILIFVFKASGANNENAVQSLIKASPIAMGLYTCLFAPFVEEIVFRKTLKDVLKNKKMFMIISFLFFGGAHVITTAQNMIDLLYIIPYGALGATFAYTYYETDSVFTTVTFHIIHNSLLFFISLI